MQTEARGKVILLGHVHMNPLSRLECSNEEILSQLNETLREFMRDLAWRASPLSHMSRRQVLHGVRGLGGISLSELSW